MKKFTNKILIATGIILLVCNIVLVSCSLSRYVLTSSHVSVMNL